MFLIEADNAENYLRARGWVGQDEPVDVRPLTGGVSNQVLYVKRPDLPGGGFVLKQARPQLRTPQPWFASVERIWREVEVMQLCDRAARATIANAADTEHGDTPAVMTPRVIHQDRDNYAFAMTAAPMEHRVWKADLLAGHFDPSIARACGTLLGRLHARYWLDEHARDRLGDRTLFEQLRIDPYYRSVARRWPQYAPAFHDLIETLAAHACTLVHADFSPKNLLVFDGGLLLVDFETGHYGDPAFDVGFFLTHLVLKAAYHAARRAEVLGLIDAFWRTYRSAMTQRIGSGDWQRLEHRSTRNLAGCAWARLDGTSQVEYLVDPARRELIRATCRELLDRASCPMGEVMEMLEERLAAVGGRG